MSRIFLYSRFTELPLTHVYCSKLTIGSEDFVAKKLTHISDEMNDVPPEPAKAYELLTQDLIRLKRMAYFAKSFSWEAGQSGVEIAGEHCWRY